MLDIGGDSGGTNWRALRVPEMWSMIERHDGAAHEDMIGGWKRSYELIVQHLSSVQRYRDGLAAAWPPERNPASRAYMQRLDALIESLRDTHDAAVENHRALAGATGALNSARRRMEEIRREHATNEVLLAGYQQDLRKYQLTPSKGKGMPPQSPVAEGRQAQLDEEARRVMASLSSELALAQVSFIEPKPYKPPISMSRRDENFPPEPNSGLPIPVATATDASFSNNGRTSESSAYPGSSPRSAPAVSDPSPALSRPGPILGEVETPSSHPPLASPTPHPSGDGRPATIGPQHHFPAGQLSPRDRLTSPPPPGSPSSRNLPASNGSINPIVRGHTSANPIIGGIPGSSTPPDSRRTQRVNPVGGLIGQPQPAAKPTHNTPGAKRHLNRETQWEAATGVDPVIKPPRDRKIDPGPVIGLN